MKNTIQNERLRVTFRYDPETLYSQRFEAAGVIEQVCLDGTFFFCEPEQRIPERVTCNGVGLCGEYVWDELAQEVAPGALFPKIGVGLLRQRPEGGAYNMWKHYEVLPFPVRASMEGDHAYFCQEGISCLGIAARLTKEVVLRGNEIHTTVTLENTGTRKLELKEYQHNFVSLQGRETGPGYRLEIPFVKSLAGIEHAAYDIANPVSRLSGYMQAQGNTIVWEQKMNGHGYHLDIPKEALDTSNGAYWKLSCEDVPVSVAERLTFEPSRVVLWGVEHCICTEVYIPISVEPGKKQTWTRIWQFTREDCHG